MTHPESDAVRAAIDVLTGKALFLKPEEMAAALAAAYPIIRADVLAEVVAELDRGPHGFKDRHEFARYVEQKFGDG